LRKVEEIETLISGKIEKRKVLASFNLKKTCNMFCGEGRVRTQDLGYQAERYDHCTARQVEKVEKFLRKG
jgi:hypothetical protein